MSDRVPNTVLAEALRAPWMITEDGLALVMSVITRANVTPEAIALREGDPLPRRASTLRTDGTMMLPVIGPIVRRADMFSRMSGATNVSSLRDELATALDTSAVQRVLLVLDSPGGEVAGITELARMIRAADATKPVYAFIEGSAASAAYYLAAAAREISGAPMSLSGSIGVRTAITKRSATPGATSFEFVSSQSPNKNAGPDTDVGRKQIQQLMDDLAAVFLSDVGTFRGLTAAQVQTQYGAGGLFAASRALSMGLIDRIETQDAVLSRIATMPLQRAALVTTPGAHAVATPDAGDTRRHVVTPAPVVVDTTTDAAVAARITRAYAKISGGN